MKEKEKATSGGDETHPVYRPTDTKPEVLLETGVTDRSGETASNSGVGSVYVGCVSREKSVSP